MTFFNTTIEGRWELDVYHVTRTGTWDVSMSNRPAGQHDRQMPPGTYNLGLSTA